MQVVVAGATGFVGRQVVLEALDQGHDVFALVRDERGLDPNLNPGGRDQLTTLPWGADPEILRQAFNIEPGALVVNAAGMHKELPGLDPHKVHESIARTVIEVAEGMQASRLVHLSPLQSPTGDAFIHSKAFTRQLIQTCGVPWSILLSAPSYGPGDDLLDGIGAWMVRSPAIPRFLEQVPLQPIWVGDLAAALLQAKDGIQEVGGELILWGKLLEISAEAAGKHLLGPTLSDDTVRRLARAFGHQPLFMDLVPFTEAGFLRHQHGYVVPQNALVELLGHQPRSLDDYLQNEWPYRWEPSPKRPSPRKETPESIEINNP